MKPVELESSEFKPRDWHNLFFRAFDALRYDRFIGSMGGEGPIYYVAISRYARDHGIEGDDLHNFHIFLNAMDAEWLKFRREQEDEDKKKRERAEFRR